MFHTILEFLSRESDRNRPTLPDKGLSDIGYSGCGFIFDSLWHFITKYDPDGITKCDSYFIRKCNKV